MRSIVVARHGGPDVLELAERPELQPTPGQVIVEVAAIGVNYIDTYQRAGIYPVQTPFTPGSEGAGRITSLGDGVHGLSVGDRVAWKSASASYATMVALPASEAIPIPDGVSDELAAALMLQGMTAHYLSYSTYPVEPGDTALVHAGAGGVGLLLTQLIRHRGGQVIATVSNSAKVDLARAAGADHVMRYEDLPARARELTNGEGVEVVYDGVGKTTFDASLASLRVRGYLVLYGGASGQVPPIDPQRLNAGGGLFLTRPSLPHYTRTREELLMRADALFGLVSAGTLDVRIGGRYPLAHARRAHEDLESRATTGKLLLIP